MATKIRTDYPGAIHHIYPRGNNKQRIFADEGDKVFFLEKLAALKAETKFSLYAYCLMPNHFHLLIQTAAYPLSKIMLRLQSSYALHAHRKYGSVGHVFQGRYPANLCARDSYFLRLIRYIHMNPVKAGLVADPIDWIWSGHRELATGNGARLEHEFPLSFFSGKTPEARRDYVDFVSKPDPDAHTDFGFAADAGSLDIRTLLDVVAAEMNLSPADVMAGGKRRPIVAAKMELTRRAVSQGIAQVDVARLLGCSSSALSQLLSRES